MEKHVLLETRELAQCGDVLAEGLQLAVRGGEGAHEVVLDDGVEEVAQAVAPVR